MIASRQKTITVLDPSYLSASAASLECGLQQKIIGQTRAIRSIVHLYQVFQSGLAAPRRPLGSMLFLGPTGSGKTRVVEAAAEFLFGDANAVLKVDCAEFQHSHEIAKLIGSPPGYLGHRETAPMLTQENLSRHHTETNPFTLVLFDEIEKASNGLWQLLLGVLDKATLTLGDNRRVDFSNTIIFMTSNLGAKEMSELISGSIGFAPASSRTVGGEGDVDQKIYRIGRDAAQRKFSPEFMNRIDKVVVFRSLGPDQLRKIIQVELRLFQTRLNNSPRSKGVSLQLSDGAINFLLDEGTDFKFGARHLKRAIERFLTFPLAACLTNGQVNAGDSLCIDIDPNERKLTFSK